MKTVDVLCRFMDKKDFALCNAYTARFLNRNMLMFTLDLLIPSFFNLLEIWS